MTARWTDAETNEAREMLKRDAHDSEFRHRFGRPKASAVYRLRYVDDPRLKDRLAALRPPCTGGLELDVSRPKSIPDSVIADAMKRRLAPRSLTASICGDPAPGFSALDRRRSA